MGRLARLFAPHWYVLVVVLALIVQRLCQCPYTRANRSIGGLLPDPGGFCPHGGRSRRDCQQRHHADDAVFNRQLNRKHLLVCGPGANPTLDDYIAGLGQLMLIIALLYAAGALMSGLVSYLMNWAGQHVLRGLRIKVFQHVQDLSLGYYAKNEAAVMSRIVNDMDTD